MQSNIKLNEQANDDSLHGLKLSIVKTASKYKPAAYDFFGFDFSKRKKKLICSILKCMASSTTLQTEYKSEYDALGSSDKVLQSMALGWLLANLLRNLADAGEKIFQSFHPILQENIAFSATLGPFNIDKHTPDIRHAVHNPKKELSHQSGFFESLKDDF